MIAFEDVSFSWNDKRIFEKISLTLPDQGCFALMGESGSGKTTLLRLLAGLIHPDAGRIKGTENKRIAVLFQEDRLLPWRPVLENAAVGATKEKAREWLKKLELPDENAMPDTLSGGMKRRVALARALAFGGDILLMDEPFKGLDQALRERTAGYVKGAGFPLILFTTHDFAEAELLSANVITLDEIRGNRNAEK